MHVGKAPPSPEMSISSLTRGRLVREDDDANLQLPRFAGHEVRPLGGLSCFWAVILLISHQRCIPHPLRREVKRLRLGPLSEGPPS